MNDEINPPRKHYKLRTEEHFQRVNPGPSQSEEDDTPIDVYQMRADQQAIEHQAGVDELEDLTPQPNRRRRDFLTLLVINNVFFGGALFFGQGNPMLMACGIAGIVVGSFGAYWLIYQIMSKY